VVQTAQLGGRKVVLIEPVESMNINAANALLKSLEEPSGDTVLLLVSHQPSRLLPTIKSRCVQQACPLPGEAMSLQWLAQALPECSEEERIELLTLAAGSPLAAVSLQSQGVREQRAGGRRGEEAAQAAAIADTTGRRMEKHSDAAPVRLVLRLVEPDPALSTDPG
jgi:DNA polymerase-3 subunit delta'